MFLDCYRVMDLTGPLGYLCGKILADLGADVIKVEPPGGDPARQSPPLVERGDNGRNQSLFWLAHNANKRGVTLDLDRKAGRQLLLRLAKKADFLLESFAPGTMESWGLGYGDLTQENPGLILVSITPYGQEGPYRNFQGSDLEIMALSGAMSLAGERDGEPMRVTVPQAPMWAGAEAAMGALTALLHRHSSGRGQHVDVSAQVAVMAGIAHAPAFWDLNHIIPRGDGPFLTGRSVSGAIMRAFWPCKDGWVNFILYGGVAGRESNQQLVIWMDQRRMAPAWLKDLDWNNFHAATITQEEVDRIEAPIGEFLATLTKREFLEGLLERHILGYPVSTAQDIYQDPQLGARCFWQDIPDPSSGRTLKYPGGFAIINGQRLPVQRPAPAVGQHNQEVFEKELGLSPSEVAAAQEPAQPGG